MTRPVLRRMSGCVAGGFEPVAILRGAAVLPHDGVGDGLAGLAIPQQRCLALIGDPDGGDVGGGELWPFSARPWRWRVGFSRWPPRRAPPNRVWGKFAGTLFAPLPSRVRRGQKQSRANWSCLGRVRVCISCPKPFVNERAEDAADARAADGNPRVAPV